MNRSLFLAIFSAILIISSAHADTLYLKNGRSLEGIITVEDKDSVELDIGFGTIAISKEEISDIKRSNPKQNLALMQDWKTKAKELKEKEEEFVRARQQRFEEYERWVNEEREKKKGGEDQSSEIGLVRDMASHAILVDTLLNGDVKCTLVLDTGASLVVLSKKIGAKLGIDLSDRTKDIIELHLAGDKKIQAKAIMLKSLRIKDVEEKEVMAAVLLEDVVDPYFKDGLLGRTFLNRFNLKIDLKTMNMALEKIG